MVDLLSVYVSQVLHKCCVVLNTRHICFSFTGYSTSLMEKNGPNLVGLFQLFARDTPQCAVSAHGE